MNIIKIIITISLSLVFLGCADKAPFKTQESLVDKALVYIYVKNPEGLNDSNRYPRYSIKIDSKLLDVDIQHEEYIALYLDASKIEISAIRATIEVQSLKLNLKAGSTYYLRVKSFSDDFAEFNFEEIPENVALKEIEFTTDARVKEDNEEKKVQVIQNLSKSDEIQKAYELKEKGILSDEEFLKLKAEILDANR